MKVPIKRCQRYYMTWRYAPNPATKETAEGLLDKLRPLSDQECMDLIRKVQAEYRLPEKARTIGEMLAEARRTIRKKEVIRAMTLWLWSVSTRRPRTDHRL